MSEGVDLIDICVDEEFKQHHSTCASWFFPLVFQWMHANFKVHKRWEDDVFKNIAKGVDDQKKDERFINDTLRSEFHKKFMEKYIK
ncbi:CWC15-like protein [Heterocephalus glaber]|uniref:Spliceosome-associated protein CWC15 homolog n=1 Tax=Heterocephalus glaber TaxID=10181 RepID=G5C6C7_HETGA|nr:CWC15-like protein [Heterocephalus glaber]